MGILDGIVEWIAKQVMAGLDLVTTSVLGALGCDMAVFLRYFPAAETMYSVFVALAIGIILLNWVWQLFKNFGLGAGVEAEDPVKLSIRSVIFILLTLFSDEIVNIVLTIGGTPYHWIMESDLPALSFADFNSVMLVIIGVCANGAVALINRLPGSPYYLESVVTALKKDGLLRTYYRDKLRGYRLGPRAKATLLESRPDRFASYLTGDTDTNRLKCEIDRRLRLHRLAETYVTMDNAGVCVYRDEKPAIFAPDGYAGGRIVYPAFFSSREVKEMGIDTTKIRSSRSTGILLAPSGIFVTYNSSSALMKWRYKSEMRVKALIWSVICQQRLAPQFRHEDVHGLILGNSMDLAYQILTSTGGRKHDFFMLDGSYEHFLYLTNNHQGEVILALLCDPVKTAELDRILLQGLTARQPGLAIEHDGVSPDGSPVLFGYFCDLPRIARFNTSLELSERPGTLICFDFQAEVLRSYCGSRVRFQTIDFTKFEGRLFP